jgi:hypothetical protein
MPSSKIEDSKNAEPWVLPLSGRLWEVIQERAKRRRIDCPFIFHQGGKKIGDIRKAWHTAVEKPDSNGFSFTTCAAARLATCRAPEFSKSSPCELPGTKRRPCIGVTGSSMRTS